MKFKQETTIKLMMKESATQQLPKFYQSDLEIDFERIRSGIATKFVWILRECGTQIAPLGVGSQPCWITSYTNGTCRARGNRFYIVDVAACTITPSTADELDRLILTPPAFNATSFEGVVERIHEVISHGVTHRIWGLWDYPSTVEEYTAEGWLAYYRKHDNTPMVEFMMQGLRLLTKYRDAAFGKKKSAA